MLRIPFKYRITFVIFTLSAMILAIVLSQTASEYLTASRNQLYEYEHSTLHLLGEYGRMALLTTDYELFQPHLEHAVNLSNVSAILLADEQGKIVSSSNSEWLGHTLEDKQVDNTSGWNLLILENLTGKVGTLAARFSETDLMQLHKEIRTSAIIWSLIGLFFICLVSLLAGHLLSRRLAWVTRAAKAVTKGDLSARSQVKGRDEVAELGFVFDSMVKKIHDDRVQLIEREQYLSLTLDSIGDAVIITDDKGYITRMNPVAEKLTACSSSEAQGLPLPEVFNIINSQNRNAISNPVEKVLLTREIIGLANHTILISKDKTEYQIADSAAPIINENGDILGVILVFRDVTQKFQVEEALRRSQKMDAIGQLSGGIAHDFNNQLGVTIGYLDFLKGQFNESEKQYKWVQMATTATLRCIDLTRQLLSFSRQSARDNAVINLNNTFDDLRGMISRSVTPEIDVQYILADDLWLTETNLGEFQDAIVNLVINARDAMPKGGKIIIETANKTIDTDLVSPDFNVKRGDYVQLVLSDTGMGMGKNNQERIFEPFFTTKPQGKGTGLGMAMVYGFIKRYHGFIKIYSELEIGSTIRLYLPRSYSAEEIETKVNQDIELPRGNESILIVDDEVALLELAKEFLSELGYKIQLAENGNLALDILQRDKNINLLFSDVVMPGGLNGTELAHKAIIINPGLKVLLTSGFAAKAVVEANLDKFSSNLLSKPYRKADLALRVRQVLDEE